MSKIALDAGHYKYTAGKRSPADEREWYFNDKVLRATVKYLNEYVNVSLLRLDDHTGQTDVSLTARTTKANAWGADVLVSIHHNALAGRWGSHGGTETYTYNGNWKDAERLAGMVHKRLVKAYNLRDRGLKKANFHMLRQSNMPSILVEGGFMDSTVDIKKLRDDKVLDNVGKAIAEGLVEYFKLKKKVVAPPKKEEVKPVTKTNSPSSWAKKDVEEAIAEGITDGSRLHDYATRQEVIVMLNRLRKL